MQKNALLALACAAALAGCDYDVPLAEKPEQAIDTALVGAWARTMPEGKTEERLLILPLGKNEYLVSYPASSPRAMFARACLCKAAGLPLVQFTWFGTAEGTTFDDAGVYQFASCTVTGDTLKGRLLNADVVDRNAASPAALATAIEANKENAHLFREEMVFKKVEPPPQADAPRKRPPIPDAWR